VDEILAALPHLTPSQVYDALSYYHDHRDEIDQLIEEARLERVVAAHGLEVEKWPKVSPLSTRRLGLPWKDKVGQ